MSETFGLTGVELDSYLNRQQQPEQIVISIVPKLKKEDNYTITFITSERRIENVIYNNINEQKGDEKKDDSISKSISKFPRIELKKANQQQIENDQIGQQGKVLGNRAIRSRSSRSITNVQLIDNVKAFVETERLLNQKEDKARSVGKKVVLKISGQVLDKEQQKKASFIEGYRRRIESTFESLYRQNNYSNVISHLKKLESKGNLQGEIKRNEDFLNRDQKGYNMIKYQMERKQKELAAIKKQINLIHNEFTTDEDRQELAAQEELQADYEQRFQYELVEQMSLQNMIDTRKQLIVFEKRKCEQIYEDYLKLGEKIHGFEEKTIQNKNKFTNLGKKILKYNSNNTFNLNPRFQELLENELSEYEDKNALQEIFKLEHERKDGLIRKEQEESRIKIEQIRFEKQKQEEKLKQEQRQIEQILNQKQKNMEELLKISCVSNIAELEERKRFLENGNFVLKQLEQEFQVSINSQKAEIVLLRKELNELKYIQKESKQQNKKEDSQQSMLQVIDEVNLTANVNIEFFEHTLIEETERMHEKENKVKKVERVVDEISLVFSRILYQLQPQNMKTRYIEVKREDLVNQITICGLKLEKIISFLAKKKDSLRIESINTDSRNYTPPDYVGINPKSYLRVNLEKDKQFKSSVDSKLSYRGDDPEESESTQYLIDLRAKIHKNVAFPEQDMRQNSL